MLGVIWTSKDGKEMEEIYVNACTGKNSEVFCCVVCEVVGVEVMVAGKVLTGGEMKKNRETGKNYHYYLLSF